MANSILQNFRYVTKSFNIRWEETTGDYATFEIILGENLQEEIFEWLSYAVNLLQSMDTKLDLWLDKQDQSPGRERDERRDCRAPE